MCGDGDRDRFHVAEHSKVPLSQQRGRNPELSHQMGGNLVHNRICADGWTGSTDRLYLYVGSG